MVELQLDMLRLHVSESELGDFDESSSGGGGGSMDIDEQQCASSSSDESDGITITIDAERLAVKRLVEDEDGVYGPKALAERDFALKREIETIVRASVHPRSNNCVLGLVNNVLIPISKDTPISDQLAAQLWRQACPYATSVLPHQDIFNEQIRRREGSAVKQHRHRRCFAIFAAHYERLALLPSGGKRQRHRAPQSSSGSSNADGGGTTNVYRYTDFAALVIADGRVVDFAVHGIISNINEMLRRYEVERVYYNSHIGDSLNTFMEYKHQPFYEACSKISRPMPMFRGTGINTTAFCPLCDPFCALCCALKDAYAFMNNADIPNERRLVYGQRSVSLLAAPQRRRRKRRPYDVQERQRRLARSEAATVEATRCRAKPPAFAGGLRSLRPTRKNCE